MEKKETCVILICMRKKCNRQAAPDRQKISSILLSRSVKYITEKYSQRAAVSPWRGYRCPFYLVNAEK